MCPGAAANRFVRSFAARLIRRDRTPAVPHVLVAGTTATTRRTEPAEERENPNVTGDDVALFDRVANELARTMPTGRGRLRLTPYWMLSDVLDAGIAATRYDERRLALRDRLYARHQDLRPVSRWLGQIADDPAPDRLSVLLRPLTLHLPASPSGGA